MKVHIIVDIPDVKDPDSAEADVNLQALTQDLESGLEGWDWHIEDATGGVK